MPNPPTLPISASQTAVQAVSRIKVPPTRVPPPTPDTPTSLPPIIHIDTPRIKVPPIATSPARPSVNLGHPLNSSILANTPHLFDSVEFSPALAFNQINPRKYNPISNTVGSPISRAVKAIQRPVNGQGHIPGEKPVVPFGQRIKAAIRAVRG